MESVRIRTPCCIPVTLATVGPELPAALRARAQTAFPVPPGVDACAVRPAAGVVAKQPRRRGRGAGAGCGLLGRTCGAPKRRFDGKIGDGRLQQLESICVGVTSGEARGQERLTPQLATVCPPSQWPGSLSGTPPLPRAAPWAGSPGGSPQPPLGLLVLKPLPALQPVPVRRAAAPVAPEGQGPSLSAPGPPAATSAPSGPVNTAASDGPCERPEKVRKPLNVKTRSGRVSRPPKHKAKDYRFIKTEDLADGRLSDSDDYSELSLEEDEAPRREHLPFAAASCALRPKTFSCPACEKAYIGRGGLARHLRLHPSHGQLEPTLVPLEKAAGSMARGPQEGRARSPASSQLSTPALLPEEVAQRARPGLQKGQSADAGETAVPGLGDGSASALPGSETRRGPGRVPSAARAEPSALGREQSRPGRPKASAARCPARLKEFLQQCDPEDLVALALPTLAQAVTVYEFLLMRVCSLPSLTEAGETRGGQPFFPAVYREFEELHAEVRKLCREYLSGSGPARTGPLQIGNSKLAESLGILEGPPREAVHGDSPAPTRTGGQEEEPELACAPKRGPENAGGAPAWVKRARRGALPLDRSPGSHPKPASWAPAAGEGPAPGVHGSTSPCPADAREGPSSPRSGASADPEPPGLSGQGVGGPGLDTRAGARGLRALGLAEKDVPEDSSDWNAGRSLGSPVAAGAVPPLAGGPGCRAAARPRGPQASPPGGPPPRPGAAQLLARWPVTGPLGSHEGDAAAEQRGPEGALAKGHLELRAHGEEQGLTLTPGGPTCPTQAPGCLGRGACS
ncbi:PREDICTED: zinc finger protein 839 [Condylura cristata]|uniref:zinc finger protein 839 n=1 Tax=Condylura cristata TaxID=143302 RepID=UPI000643445B|nr:PREDICTED: zinc finger protein 839 [Condylura cristata]